MYSGNQIREMFLKYFERNGHTIVASSSLVPHDDPTLLFTNAGMNQFKDVFLGLDKRAFTRATTSQKCVRAGGKHNDLDTVGRTPRHHTFFEMLGNFSFGDYFKPDAILFAWEFLTQELKIPQDKLWVTVFQDDDEAKELWIEKTNVAPDRIIKLGEKDNFWSMGDTGPCGPCSEIMYDRGLEFSCGEPDCAVGKCDCDRWLEIWNLVFMQYNRDQEGKMTPLPRPSIDTGMGLERVASVMQQVGSNYDTDLLQELVKAVENLSGKSYQKDEQGFPFRVVADHSRACTFLVGDGVLPNNEGRGYVLRRILRRAVRFGKLLGINDPFIYRMVPVVIELMGKSYPEIKEKQDYIMRVIQIEEQRFHETLADGMKMVEEIVARVKAKGTNVISGQDAFVLYDTYGFPLDLTGDIAEENGLTLDTEGFNLAMTEQRERARAARQDVTFMAQNQELYAEIGQRAGATQFVGYNNYSATSNVVAIIKNNQQIEEATIGDQIQIVLNETPFYGESGGQVGDKGLINSVGLNIEVSDTKKAFNGVFVHHARITEGTLKEGQIVECTVDIDHRLSIARNHSTTHLLHKALKQVLGEHVNQGGSLVEPDKMRFDFTHFTAVDPEKLKLVETIVNKQILADLSIEAYETDIEAAKALGAAALFGEKYGDVVRVVKMGDFSLELCGGTHLQSTSQVGLFKIISESGVGAGLRRIEAVTGQGALAYLENIELQLKTISSILKTPQQEAVTKVENLLKQVKEKDKEIEALQNQLSKYETKNILDDIVEIKGIKVLVAKVSAPDMDALRNVGDMLRDKIGSGVVIIGAETGDKASFVGVVTKDLLGKGLHAGNIIREVAKVAEGGGGGRPDMAQAGGKNPAKINDALTIVPNLVESQIK